MGNFIDVLMDTFMVPNYNSSRQTRKLSFDIEQDHKDIVTLLESAQKGIWQKVWTILETKPYLVNCCPENSHYTVLHHAVRLNAKEQIIKLLDLPTIDIEVNTKEGTPQSGYGKGVKASELAHELGYRDICELFQRDDICNIEKEEIATFHTSTEGYSLFRLTLAGFKNTFHPSKIDSSKPITTVFEDVYHSMNTTEMWKHVRDNVSQSMSQFSQEYSEKIMQCTERSQFYITIIEIYTTHGIKVYARVNTALRRQRLFGFKPTAVDLALGPYILVFHLLIIFWNKLQTESKRTYRQVLLSEFEQQQYTKGTEFFWLSFVSTSAKKTKAIAYPEDKIVKVNQRLKTLFIFDNSSPRSWQPKNIEKFAQFDEEERLFPAGCRFVVTGRETKDDETFIYLKPVSNV